MKCFLSAQFQDKSVENQINKEMQNQVALQQLMEKKAQLKSMITKTDSMFKRTQTMKPKSSAEREGTKSRSRSSSMTMMGEQENET